MKPTIPEKLLYIAVYGFFASPFIVIGFFAGAAYNAALTGWLWADRLLEGPNK